MIFLLCLFNLIFFNYTNGKSCPKLNLQNVVCQISEDDTTITFSGNGNINDHDSHSSCYFENVKNVIIGENISYIGSRTFQHCNMIESIKIEGNSKLIIIGDEAISGCTN